MEHALGNAIWRLIDMIESSPEMLKAEIETWESAYERLAEWAALDDNDAEALRIVCRKIADHLVHLNEEYQTLKSISR